MRNDQIGIRPGSKHSIAGNARKILTVPNNRPNMCVTENYLRNFCSSRKQPPMLALLESEIKYLQ